MEPHSKLPLLRTLPCDSPAPQLARGCNYGQAEAKGPVFLHRLQCCTIWLSTLSRKKGFITGSGDGSTSLRQSAEIAAPCFLLSPLAFRSSLPPPTASYSYIFSPPLCCQTCQFIPLRIFSITVLCIGSPCKARLPLARPSLRITRGSHRQSGM